MQLLLIYDKQWNIIICCEIIGFRGWPEFLRYTSSVENIRCYLLKEIYPSDMYPSNILFSPFNNNYKTNEFRVSVVKNRNWKLHGVKKLANIFTERIAGNFNTWLLILNFIIYSHQKITKSSQNWMHVFYILLPFDNWEQTIR